MILRAKYVVCDSRRYISDGVIQIAGKKIKRIGRASEGDGALDLGNVAIAPGFVNAHTHLLYRRRIPFSGDFTEWLRSAGEARWALTREAQEIAKNESLAEALAAGTTTIASSEMPEECAIRGYEFTETICFDEDLVEEKTEELRHRISYLTERGIHGCPGPHAPYTVSRPLLESCARLAREQNLPLSIHVAETPLEAAFLLGAKNSLYKFLDSAGFNLEDWNPPLTTPVRYLADLGMLGGKTLLAHCNYLTAEEIDIIARSGASVIYCPRSSGFFGHRDHPLRYLIEKGVNVALGTDSLAGCETLSILDEVKFLARRSPKTPPAEFWRMATANGAAALGLKNRTGRLKEGMDADAAVIDIGGCEGRDVFDKIAADESRVVATIAAGKLVHGTNDIASSIKDKFNA